MPVKISKKVREEAALICAIAASGGVTPERGDRRSRVYGEIHRSLGVGGSDEALGLAIYAYVCLSEFMPWTPEFDAEAEAMIRTGWTP